MKLWSRNSKAVFLNMYVLKKTLKKYQDEYVVNSSPHCEVFISSECRYVRRCAGGETDQCITISSECRYDYLTFSEESAFGAGLCWEDLHKLETADSQGQTP